MLRKYATNYGANIFDYTAQVNKQLLKENSYYKSGNLIGNKALKKVMSNFFMAERVRYFQKGKFNRQIGS
jgi:penicillin-binding protein 2